MFFLVSFFILGILCSTALYGIISFVICVVISQAPISELISIALCPKGFHEMFIAYMIWSIPAYIVLSVIYYLLAIIHHNQYPDYIRKTLKRPNIGKKIIGDLAKPFRALREPITLKNCFDRNLMDDCTGWDLVQAIGSAIISFIWSLALCVWVIWGLISIVTKIVM